MRQSLFEQLCIALNAEIVKDRAHAVCPFCGASPKRKQVHFSLWQAGPKHSKPGCKCFVCGKGMGLGELAKHLELTPAMPARDRQTAQDKRKTPNQYEHMFLYLERSCGHLERLQRWQAYKPLSLESISRFRLGVGLLPFLDERGRIYHGKHHRLIVPTFDAAFQCVGLEGRAIYPDDTGPKWICATGTRKDVLFNAHLLRPGVTVIIPENKVDCILAMQGHDDVVAVTGGGSFWLDEWTGLIAASRPKRVIVWRDNDLVGQPNEWTRRALLVEWRKKTAERLAGQSLPWPPEPIAIGPVIANQFLSLDIPTTLYRWPRSAPPKADLGWSLSN